MSTATNNGSWTIVSYMCVTAFGDPKFTVEYATSPLVVAQLGKYVHATVEPVMKEDRSTTPVVLQYTHSSSSDGSSDCETTYFGASLRLSGSHNSCLTVFSRFQLYQTMMQLLCDIADRVDYSVLGSEAPCRQFSSFMGKLVNTTATDVIPMYPFSIGPVSILRPDDSALTNLGTPLSALVFCFSPEAIRLMLSIALQEGRIVFVGPGCSIGAAAAVSLLSILSPMQWPHQVLTCLGEQFLPLLHDLDNSSGKPFVAAIDSSALPALMLMGTREPVWIADCRTGKVGLCRTNATTLPNAGIQSLIAPSDRLRDSIRKFISADQQRQWLRLLTSQEHTHCPPPLSIPSQRELLLSFLEYNVAHLVGNYRKGVASSVLTSASSLGGSTVGAFDWSKFLTANLDGNVRYATAVANTVMFGRFVQWILGMERGGKVALRELAKTPFLEICTRRFPELYTDVLPPEKNSTASATGKFFMSMMTKAKGAVVSTLVGQTTSVPMLEFVQFESSTTSDMPLGNPASVQSPAPSITPMAQLAAASAMPMPKVPRLPLDIIHNFAAYHKLLWNDDARGDAVATPPVSSPVHVSSSPVAPSASALPPRAAPPSSPAETNPSAATAPSAALDLFQYVSYPSAEGTTHKIQCPTEVERIKKATPVTSPAPSTHHANPSSLDVDKFFQ